VGHVNVLKPERRRSLEVEAQDLAEVVAGGGRQLDDALVAGFDRQPKTGDSGTP